MEMDNEYTYKLINKAKLGDNKAMTMLINNNSGLIWSVVRRYINCGQDKDDLYQLGAMGFIKAVKNFNTELKLKLSTYAVPMISGEIKRYLRDNGPIKISRKLKMIYIKYGIEKEKYYKLYGKECDLKKLAEVIGVDAEELVLAINANESITSINKTIINSDGSETNIIEKIENPKLNPENNIERLNLSLILNKMESLDKKIIKLRYIENKTQTETGMIVGMSQVSVSRLEKKILKKIRENMN